MASLRFADLILFLFSVTFLFVSPSHSLTCTSQNFKNNNLYTNCSDLPSLSAYLHWTYNSTTSSLSIAFIAPPAKSDGWIAWAINPTGTGMVGAQSLVAFKQSDGSVAVKTYKLNSYSSIQPSNLSLPVSHTSAEYSVDQLKIFATVTLPENASSVNHVWQVGGSVTNGAPDRHEFQSANLNAKGTLDLVTGKESNGTTGSGTHSNAPSPAPALALAPSPSSAASSPTGGAPQNGSGNGAVSRFRNCNSVFYMLFLAGFIFYF
ncbi:hypothetical protein U1Q18_020543 [Sarracenia purpurea var. burkii]